MAISLEIHENELKIDERYPITYYLGLLFCSK
jgi:hypothetical protein